MRLLKLKAKDGSVLKDDRKVVDAERPDKDAREEGLRHLDDHAVAVDGDDDHEDDRAEQSVWV